MQISTKSATIGRRSQSCRMLNQRQYFLGACSQPFSPESLHFDKILINNDFEATISALNAITDGPYKTNKLNKIKNLRRSISKDIITIAWMDWYPHWNIYDNFIIDLLTLFNIKFQITEHPEDADLIFAGVYDFNILRTKIYEQKFIVLVSGENVRPNYLYYDYSITTDSYSYSGKNIRWPEYFSQLSFDNQRNIHLKEDLQKLSGFYRQWDNRDIMFSIIYNNACPHREHYTNLLREKYGYNAVQSYGSSRINRDCNKYEILGRSKFHLAFENSLYPGYVTEKLFQSLLMGTFALYWGANDVSHDFGSLGYTNLAGNNFSDDAQLFDFIDRFCAEQSLRASLNRSSPSIDHLNPGMLSSILDNTETMLKNIFKSLLYYKSF